MKKQLAVVFLAFFAVPGLAHAYLLTEDIPNLTHNMVSQIENYAQYIEQTMNQLTQITNQITQIENQVIQLERFGNPQYYVNLLHLNDFLASAAQLESGVGQTVSAFRQAADGAQALAYTANGLYSNLQGSVDRFGNAIRYDTSSFRKFQTVNNMVEAYNTQEKTYNNQIASLEQQLSTAVQNLNSASDHMSAQKYAAQIAAISAQINALGHTTHLTGQRAVMQQVQNQNDAARMQEAQRQQMIQERQTDLQNAARFLSNLVGGSGNSQQTVP
jgi:conjugal transfer/entry exclusion protein